MTTLTYGVTTLTLDHPLLWTDELQWSPVREQREYSITGALLVEHSTRQAGRPVTLASGSWMTRAQLDQLAVWAAVPGAQLMLSVRGEPAFAVLFDHGAGWLQADPVHPEADPQPDDHYRVTLRFIAV